MPGKNPKKNLSRSFVDSSKHQQLAYNPKSWSMLTKSDKMKRMGLEEFQYWNTVYNSLANHDKRAAGKQGYNFLYVVTKVTRYGNVKGVKFSKLNSIAKTMTLYYHDDEGFQPEKPDWWDTEQIKWQAARSKDTVREWPQEGDAQMTSEISDPDDLDQSNFIQAGSQNIDGGYKIRYLNQKPIFEQAKGAFSKNRLGKKATQQHAKMVEDQELITISKNVVSKNQKLIKEEIATKLSFDVNCMSAAQHTIQAVMSGLVHFAKDQFDSTDFISKYPSYFNLSLLATLEPTWADVEALAKNNVDPLSSEAQFILDQTMQTKAVDEDAIYKSINVGTAFQSLESIGFNVYKAVSFDIDLWLDHTQGSSKHGYKGKYIQTKMATFITGTLQDNGGSFLIQTDPERWLRSITSKQLFNAGAVLLLKFLKLEEMARNVSYCKQCSQPSQIYFHSGGHLKLPHCSDPGHGGSKHAHKLPYVIPTCPLCNVCFGEHGVAVLYLAQHMLKHHHDVCDKITPPVTIQCLKTIIESGKLEAKAHVVLESTDQKMRQMVAKEVAELEQFKLAGKPVSSHPFFHYCRTPIYKDSKLRQLVSRATLEIVESTEFQNGITYQFSKTAMEDPDARQEAQKILQSSVQLYPIPEAMKSSYTLQYPDVARLRYDDVTGGCCIDFSDCGEQLLRMMKSPMAVAQDKSWDTFWQYQDEIVWRSGTNEGMVPNSFQPQDIYVNMDLASRSSNTVKVVNRGNYTYVAPRQTFKVKHDPVGLNADYTIQTREWFVKHALVNGILKFIDLTTPGNNKVPIFDFWNQQQDHGAWWDDYFNSSDQPWKQNHILIKNLKGLTPRLRKLTFAHNDLQFLRECHPSEPGEDDPLTLRPWRWQATTSQKERIEWGANPNSEKIYRCDVYAKCSKTGGKDERVLYPMSLSRMVVGLVDTKFNQTAVHGEVIKGYLKKCYPEIVIKDAPTPDKDVVEGSLHKLIAYHIYMCVEPYIELLDHGRLKSNVSALVCHWLAYVFFQHHTIQSMTKNTLSPAFKQMVSKNKNLDAKLTAVKGMRTFFQGSDFDSSKNYQDRDEVKGQLKLLVLGNEVGSNIDSEFSALLMTEKQQKLIYKNNNNKNPNSKGSNIEENKNLVNPKIDSETFFWESRVHNGVRQFEMKGEICGELHPLYLMVRKGYNTRENQQLVNPQFLRLYKMNLLYDSVEYNGVLSTQGAYLSSRCKKWHYEELQFQDKINKTLLTAMRYDNFEDVRFIGLDYLPKRQLDYTEVMFNWTPGKEARKILGFYTVKIQGEEHRFPLMDAQLYKALYFAVGPPGKKRVGDHLESQITAVVSEDHRKADYKCHLMRYSKSHGFLEDGLKEYDIDYSWNTIRYGDENPSRGQPYGQCSLNLLRDAYICSMSFWAGYNPGTTAEDMPFYVQLLQTQIAHNPHFLPFWQKPVPKTKLNWWGYYELHPTSRVHKNPKEKEFEIDDLNASQHWENDMAVFNEDGFLHLSYDNSVDDTGYKSASMINQNYFHVATVNPDKESMTEEEFSYELTKKWEIASHQRFTPYKEFEKFYDEHKDKKDPSKGMMKLAIQKNLDFDKSIKQLLNRFAVGKSIRTWSTPTAETSASGEQDNKQQIDSRSKPKIAQPIPYDASFMKDPNDMYFDKGWFCPDDDNDFNALKEEVNKNYQELVKKAQVPTKQDNEEKQIDKELDTLMQSN